MHCKVNGIHCKVKITINRVITVSKIKKIDIMFIYSDKELDVSLNYQNNILSLLKFGQYREDEAIGIHYLFDSLGNLISKVNYNK